MNKEKPGPPMGTPPTYEFQISRKARDRYRFGDTFFSITGDVVFANTRAAQEFAAAINSSRQRSSARSRPSSSRKNEPVSASEIYAMGLFHEVIHFVIGAYASDVNPGVRSDLELWLSKNVGEKDVTRAQSEFIELFPPSSVYRNEESAGQFMLGSDYGMPHRLVALEEMILVWLENRNPAFGPISELVDDSSLKKKTAYDAMLSEAEKFFDLQPRFGPAGSTLLKMLLMPVESHPDSIVDQLRFIAENWKSIIGRSPYLSRILRALDFAKEEGRYFLMLAQAQAERSRMPKVRQAGFGGFGDKGPAPVLRFGAGEVETENFSRDLNWMPRLVLIAKNVYVWLDQLSRRYRRSINRLDEIPDDELEALAGRGFTGLWLIGIWMRSEASRRIKNISGNPDAMASAYSLHEYEIDPALGGDWALRNLKDRAIRFGIRMGSDMVPNHMGIDSSWVVNHPDWFLQSEYPPFPNYTFNGPDLGGDERVGVFIEDGYWSKTDAAVVFKRLDRWSGDVKYIYHGNDGTHMPWNDTAQLDFTKSEVREAVIQTIVKVSSMFPIVRFDAAMVLTKKHYQRLWFPEPGTGGAIPSRSNFSMTREEFDAAMPTEFWREVVDRVQKEAPDTLLLAEAFWLMEGYFVRTLGMHRVYNSAFMNMLKREENANYRQVIKNVLEYNPQILKRFVNFVNNPDEDTAIAQFGKDDKYFGVCVMMVTMPGLPMFGHGQVEGLTEKYGMEFRRAYRNEEPDAGLVRRHEREIFPLLKMRRAFSEVENFYLYDLFTADGTVNEDVYAYSNSHDGQRSIVVYNNRYTFASGWIKTSVSYRDRSNRLVGIRLAEGLGLAERRSGYCVFTDVISGLEYIRSIKSFKEDGLYIELGAYKYAVYVNFREVDATKETPYDEVCRKLDGKGVVSVEEETALWKLKDIHRAFYEALNAGSLKYLLDGLFNRKMRQGREKAVGEKAQRIVLSMAAYHPHHAGRVDSVKSAESRYKALGILFDIKTGDFPSRSLAKAIHSDDSSASLSVLRTIFLWLFMRSGDRDLAAGKPSAVNLFDVYKLTGTVRNCFAESGVGGETSDIEMALADILLRIPAADRLDYSTLAEKFTDMLELEPIRRFMIVHEFEGATWFNKERFEDFVHYFALIVAVEQVSGDAGIKGEKLVKLLGELAGFVSTLKRAASGCGYRFDQFQSGFNLKGKAGI